MEPAARFLERLAPDERLVWHDELHPTFGFVARLFLAHAWRFATVSRRRIALVLVALSLAVFFGQDYAHYRLAHIHDSPIDQSLGFFGFVSALCFIGVVPSLIVVAARVADELRYRYAVTDRGRALFIHWNAPVESFLLPARDAITTNARATDELGDIAIGDGRVFRRVRDPFAALEAIRAAAKAPSLQEPPAPR